LVFTQQIPNEGLRPLILYLSRRFGPFLGHGLTVAEVQDNSVLMM